jgi:opacity protein-like surface antigen
MRKVLCLTAALATAALLASGSDAAAQLYLGGSLGATQPSDNSSDGATLSYKTGWIGNLSVGYKLPMNFRAEIEGGYSKTDFDKISVAGTSVGLSGHLRVWTAMANLFYDIPLGGGFVPYVGGGLGVANERAENVGALGVNFGSSSSETDFAWQAEVGLGYQVTPQLTIAPAYRFMMINDASGGFDNTQIHIFKLGLRYAF